MFTDAEDVQAELVGELDLLQQVPHPLLGTDRLPGLRVGVELREGVEADLHAHSMVPHLLRDFGRAQATYRF